MALPLPTSLSPSKVAAFKDCALAFRYSAIDRLPEAPSAPAVRGTLVHRALQILFWETPAGQRTPEAARAGLARAWAELGSDAEFLALDLDDDGRQRLLAEAEVLMSGYFALEDPDQVRVLGVEVMLEARLGDLRLRGIIDRLELDPDGQLVVTDYKTGRSPGASFELPRMAGVHFYAFLCEQVLGRRPARIQLLHLAEPVAISLVPSEQSLRGLRTRATAIWSAVERACATEDFRPKVSGLCDYCAYKAHCPAFGGQIVTPGPVHRQLVTTA